MLHRRQTIILATSLGLLFSAAASAQETAPAAPVAQPAPTAPVVETPAAETPAAETPAAATPAEQPAPAATPVAPETAPAAVETTPDAAAPAAVEAAPAQAQAPVDTTVPEAIAADEPAVAPAPASLPSSTLPHDLSPWGMFMAADYVVKAVMIGLALASLATWIVWFAKTLELLGAKRRARRALRAITSSRTLAEATAALERRRGVGVLLIKAAGEEVELSAGALDYAGGSGLKDRVSSRLSRISAAAGRRISRGTGILASVGSVSPFVGLFGTVWGIMNAFIGISEAQTTNLAIVAPGIAEALLATAIGLVAAIPAVIIYNAFSRSITGYRQLLADMAAAVERLVSRDLDYRTVPAGQA